MRTQDPQHVDAVWKQGLERGRSRYVEENAKISSEEWERAEAAQYMERIAKLAALIQDRNRLPGSDELARLSGRKDDEVGIAIGRDGHLYVNTFVTGELFRIEVKSGSPGKVTKLKTSRPLTHPDGLRPFRGDFIMVEGGGTLDRITIDGDSAKVETIAEVVEPTSVWLTADRVWVSEGQFSYLLNPEKKGQVPDSFKLRALPLPKY